jgi:outer membrane protein assembly factor BamA
MMAVVLETVSLGGSRGFWLLPLWLILTGGKFFSVSDMPPAFPEDLAFGAVITEIRIVGNETTRIGIIKAAMQSKAGEVYTREAAVLDYKWITQLGVFTSIRFETIEENDGIVLVVTLTEVNRYTPAPVIKVTDANGLSIGASFTSTNVLGVAAKASAYFTVGGVTNFGVRYKDPWIPGRSWWFGYTLSYEHAERPNEIYHFDERSDDVFFELEHNVTNKVRWGPRLTYLAVRSDQPGVTLSPDNVDHIPALGAFARFDGRDLPIYPTQGWWAGLDIIKYGPGGLGDPDYWQASLDVRRYLRLGGQFNSLALYSLATLSSGEVGVDIPIYMQFNLGGANSVRGWSLGSREGKNQFINTIEYWHVLMDHKAWRIWFFKFALGFQLGVFGDVGTAWSNRDAFHRNWVAGGGAGLRLLMPASVMFRFDLAAGEEGIGVRFFISGKEKAVAQRDRVR